MNIVQVQIKVDGHGVTVVFWSRTESKAIRSNPPTSFKPWLFWRVDYDSKGPYLSLRYYREASNESDEIIRKNIYDKLSDIIYSTIGNEKDELKRLYKKLYFSSSLW